MRLKHLFESNGLLFNKFSSLKMENLPVRLRYYIQNDFQGSYTDFLDAVRNFEKRNPDESSEIIGKVTFNPNLIIGKLENTTTIPYAAYSSDAEEIDYHQSKNSGTLKSKNGNPITKVFRYVNQEEYESILKNGYMYPSKFYGRIHASSIPEVKYREPNGRLLVIKIDNNDGWYPKEAGDGTVYAVTKNRVSADNLSQISEDTKVVDSKLLVRESPIPDDWDKEQFSLKRLRSDRDYERMVSYAKEKASTLGVGSSRIVFDIEYNGRRTALKVALNVKGLSQNRAEVEITEAAMKTGVTIAPPIIDYDDKFVWVHVEKANKASEFQILTGLFKGFDAKPETLETLYTLDTLIDEMKITVKLGAKERIKRFNQRARDAIARGTDASSLIDMSQSIVDLVHNPKTFVLMKLSKKNNMLLGDLRRVENWGIYQGEIVVVDLGFTEETSRLYI